jgi:hypothetical protein
MQEERWALGTAGARVRLDGQVGVIEVRGLVCNRVLETLHGRIGSWAAWRGPLGYALVLGWESVLTANGPREVAACLRGSSRLAAAALPAAMVVPPERLAWATKHCLQLAEHGLSRAAFDDRAKALQWVQRRARAFAGRSSATHRSVPSASRTARPSSGHQLSEPAPVGTLKPASGLDSLRL